MLSKTKQAKRRQILDTALQLILEKGIVGTTVQEIALLASIDRKTFYNYFPDLNAVVQALAAEYNEQVWDGLTSEDSSLNGLAQLEFFMNKLFEVAFKNRALMLMTLHFEYQFSQHKLFMGAQNLDELIKGKLYQIVRQGSLDGSIEMHGLSVESLLVTLFVPLFSGIQKYYQREDFYAQTFHTDIEDLRKYIQIVMKGLDKKVLVQKTSSD